MLIFEVDIIFDISDISIDIEVIVYFFGDDYL